MMGVGEGGGWENSMWSKFEYYFHNGESISCPELVHNLSSLLSTERSGMLSLYLNPKMGGAMAYPILMYSSSSSTRI